MKWASGVIAVLIVGLLMSGCYKQKGASAELVSQSGFLPQSVYAKMRDGDAEKYEPARVYRNDKALGKGKYNKIMIDPIVVFANPYKEGEGLTPEDAQTVVNYFHSSLVEKIKESPHMTEASGPGPGTVRMSIAITDMEGSDVALDTVSMYIPQVGMLARIGTMHREKPAFVGQLGIEFKVQDSQTAQLLAAGVDLRFGGKALGKDLDEWADVRRIIDWYVDVLSWRACKIQGRSTSECEKFKPSET